MVDYKKWYTSTKKDYRKSIDDLVEAKFDNDEQKRVAFCAVASAILETELPKASEGKSKRMKDMLKGSKKDIKNFYRQVELVATGKTPNTNEYSVKLSHAVTNALAQVLYIKMVTQKMNIPFYSAMYDLMNVIENTFDLEEISMEFHKQRQEWARKSE